MADATVESFVWLSDTMARIELFADNKIKSLQNSYPPWLLFVLYLGNKNPNECSVAKSHHGTITTRTMVTQINAVNALSPWWLIHLVDCRCCHVIVPFIFPSLPLCWLLTTVHYCAILMKPCVINLFELLIAVLFSGVTSNHSRCLFSQPFWQTQPPIMTLILLLWPYRNAPYGTGLRFLQEKFPVCYKKLAHVGLTNGPVVKCRTKVFLCVSELVLESFVQITSVTITDGASPKWKCFHSAVTLFFSDIIGRLGGWKSTRSPIYQVLIGLSPKD